MAGCDLLSYMPQQDWIMDVKEHWSNLRDFLQHEAAVWFPRPKRQQRQLYFDEETWNLVCTRQDLRQHQRQLQRDLHRALLSYCFYSWRQQDKDVGTEWSRNRSLLWQQEALKLAAGQSADRLYRRAKKQAWKQWIEQQLAEKCKRHKKHEELTSSRC